MGQALYRQYRPKSLDEVVGQEHITSTLQKSIDKGRISHAYLFTGPRGVGKTSIARILAHQINNIEYSDDSAHIDIIEIDAASNRRIDEIRELRDKVYVAPTSAKYKVYIIDEVHMLTREAFNALLKTLEEPPAHVVFILATTDAHKLPETIISRTQRFSFKPANETDLVTHLKKLAKAEKFEISDGAIELIAKHGGGSFRDSVSLLDQAGSQGGKVDQTAVQAILGLPSAEAIDEIQQLIGGNSARAVMQALSQMYGQGYQATAIAEQLSTALRAGLINGTSNLEPDNVLNLLNQLVGVSVSNDPERALEIALLKSNPNLFSAKTQPAPTPKVEPEVKKEVVAEIKIEPEPIKQETVNEADQAEIVEISAAKLKFDTEIWPEVLKELKKRYNTLYGIIRMAEPNFSENGKLQLAVSFAFHQKRLNEDSNRKKLVDTIHTLTGQTVKLECIIDKSAKPPQIKVEASVVEPLAAEGMTAEKPVSDSNLTAINNIFGSTEVLKS